MLNPEQITTTAESRNNQNVSENDFFENEPTDDTILEDAIRGLYLKQKLSSRQTALGLGCSQSTCLKLMKLYGIPRRGRGYRRKK